MCVELRAITAWACCRFSAADFIILTQLLGKPKAAAKSKAPLRVLAKPRAEGPGVPESSHIARRSSRRQVRFEEPPEGSADAAQLQQEDTAGPSSPTPPEQSLLEPPAQSLLEQERQQCLGMFQTNGLAEVQRKLLEQMGLGTKGPADTTGNGECQFRSFSQSEAVVCKGTIWAMTNSDEAQSGYASAMSTAAFGIRDNPVIQEGIVDCADQLTSDNRYQGSNYQQALQGQDASALPGLVADSIQKPISSGSAGNDTWAAFVGDSTLMCV